MKRLLKNVFYVLLVLTILSNTIVHINQIKETSSNTIQTIVNTNMIAFNHSLMARNLKGYLGMVMGLYNKVAKLEKKVSDSNYIIGERLDVLGKLKKKEVVLPLKPDFETLMNGTVAIYNKGYMVAGVTIYEDENYYYILTVHHLLWRGVNGIRSLDNVIPESNMGIATKLEAIALFINKDELKELIPRQEIINTTVQTRDHTMIAGELLYANPLLDLAILRVYKVDGLKLEILPISNTIPKVGDGVYVLGHPLGRKYNLSKGIVSNLDRPFIMGIDALMTFGNSGGGVFNTKGEIIGICSRVPVYPIQIPKPEEKNEEQKETIEYLPLPFKEKK